MPNPEHTGYSPTLCERLADAPHPSISFQSSFWHASAPPGPQTERLEGEARTALAVIGGGYLGFSTALHLAASPPGLLTPSRALPLQEEGGE